MAENKMVMCINCDNALIAKHRRVYPSKGLVSDWVIDNISCDCKMPHVSEYFEGNCTEFKQRRADW